MNITMLVFAISIILAIYGTYRVAKHKQKPLQSDLSLLLLRAAEQSSDINKDCEEMRRFLNALKTIRNNEGGKRVGELLAKAISQITQEDKLPLLTKQNAQSIVKYSMLKLYKN